MDRDSGSDSPSAELDRRVDWMGAVLVTAGVVCIMFVLGQGDLAPQKWKTPCESRFRPALMPFVQYCLADIIALLIVGVALLVAFIVWEDYLGRKTTLPPLMRLDIWTRARGKFAAVQIIAFLEWSSFMSWILWVQLYYQSYKVRA